MLAPDKDERSFKWRFAARKGGTAYYPAFQVVAAVGIVWAGFHFASLPLVPRYWYLLVYWAAWIGWFLVTAWVSLPETMRARMRNR